MKCPLCGSQQLFIVDSRQFDTYVKRMRMCLNCNAKIPTVEINKVTDEALNSLNLSKTIMRRKRARKETELNENL